MGSLMSCQCDSSIEYKVQTKYNKCNNCNRLHNNNDEYCIRCLKTIYINHFIKCDKCDKKFKRCKILNCVYTCGKKICRECSNYYFTSYANIKVCDICKEKSADVIYICDDCSILNDIELLLDKIDMNDSQES